jgi:hypothetical protein
MMFSMPFSAEAAIRKGQTSGSASAQRVGLLHRFILKSVRCDELNFQSSTPTSGSTTKLQHVFWLVIRRLPDQFFPVARQQRPNFRREELVLI